jgi:quinol monooxygenase YgiN
VRDASGKPGDDYWPEDRTGGDYMPEGQYVTYGQGRPGPAQPPGDFPGSPAPRGVPDGDRGRRPGPPPRPPERPDRYRGPGPRGSRELATDERAATQPVSAPGPEAGAAAESGLPASAAGSPAAGSPAAAAARPYGRILIFTVLDDRIAEFDRLAEETAEHVRTGEPDTLVYVIHLVPNAPMQRIFYEIYRDRAAFDSHESQPHMQRFVAERRACVLATNVIELRLKYAKVAPLPSPQPAAAAAPAPAPAPLPPGPPRRPQRPQPLPAAAGPRRPQGPSGPQRSDQPRYGERYDERYDQPGYDQPGYEQPRYDQPRADRERYDERRPDQRQVPSGRPYGG